MPDNGFENTVLNIPSIFNILSKVRTSSMEFVIAAANSTAWAKSTADFVCSGSADQVLINSVLNTIRLNGVGGSLFFRAGTYNLTGSIVIDQSYITLDGECHPGWGGYIHTWDGATPTASVGSAGAKLLCTTTGFDCITIQHNNVPDNGENRHRGIHIQSLYLVGPGTVPPYTQTGISGASSDDWCEICENYFQRFQDGITGSWDSPTIHDNSFQDNSGSFINCSTLIFGRIANNLVYDIGGNGVHLQTSNGCIITANVFGDITGTGILLDTNSTGVVITGNSFGGFFNNSFIQTNGGNGHTISNNGFNGYSQFTGLNIGYTQASTGILLSGNTIGYVGGEAAIALRNGSYCVCSSNSVFPTGSWPSTNTTTIMWAAPSVVVNNIGDTNTSSGVNGPAVITTGFYCGWWKADAVSGTASGSVLSNWIDSSGLGHTMAATASPVFLTNQVNGKPAVSFNGSTQYFSVAVSPLAAGQRPPYTLYVVCKQLVNSGNQDPIGNGGGGGGPFINSNLNFYAGSAATGPSWTSGVWAVVECQSNDPNSILSVNGTAVTGLTFGTHNIGNTFYIGCNGATVEQWNGLIAEAVWVSGAISSADRLAIRQALYTKYSIAGT